MPATTARKRKWLRARGSRARSRSPRTWLGAVPTFRSRAPCKTAGACMSSAVSTTPRHASIGSCKAVARARAILGALRPFYACKTGSSRATGRSGCDGRSPGAWVQANPCRGRSGAWLRNYRRRPRSDVNAASAGNCSTSTIALRNDCPSRGAANETIQIHIPLSGDGVNANRRCARGVQAARQTTMTAAPRNRPRLEEVEPHILYSADAAPLVDAAPPVVVEQRTLESNGEFAAAVPADTVRQGERYEVVFVDASVPDSAKLLADIAAQQLPGKHVETVLIAPDADGVAVIGDTLAQRHDVSAVHIVGHGADGEVMLGATRLDFDSLLRNATPIKGWGNALTQDADLLLYGCDVARSESGRALVDALARLTGADVAASDDLTGSAQLGGDWDLEYRNGEVTTALVLSAAERDTWSGVLDEAPPVVPAQPQAVVNAATPAAIAAIPMAFE